MREKVDYSYKMSAHLRLTYLQAKLFTPPRVILLGFARLNDACKIEAINFNRF